MTLPRAALAASFASIAILASCTTDDDEAAEPVAPQTTAASTTAASPGLNPTSEPATPVAGGWASKENGKAALDAFVADLDQADRYRVDRAERVVIGGEYMEVRQEHIVDLAAERVGSVQVFALSNEQMAELLIGDADVSLEDLETHMVFDYAGESNRVLMTYPRQWDGRWLELTSEAAAAEDPLLGELYEGTEPEDHVASFLEVASLQPMAFAPSTNALQFDVPAELAVSWIPNRTALLATQAGIDIFAISISATGSVIHVPGGVEMTIDVTPLLQSLVADLADQPEIAQLLQQSQSFVTVRVRDLGTTDEIVMPAEDAISDEPWD